MAIVEESRPGRSTFVELGGSYAQPSASPHATWTGQTIRQMGWSGERNSGQPMYGAGSHGDNPAEVAVRFRTLAGDTLDRWSQDAYDANMRVLDVNPDTTAKDRVKMQLYSLAFM